MSGFKLHNIWSLDPRGVQLDLNTGYLKSCIIKMPNISEQILFWLFQNRTSPEFGWWLYIFAHSQYCATAQQFCILLFLLSSSAYYFLWSCLLIGSIKYSINIVIWWVREKVKQMHRWSMIQLHRYKLKSMKFEK